MEEIKNVGHVQGVEGVFNGSRALNSIDQNGDSYSSKF
jgi:hypothetical protein